MEERLVRVRIQGEENGPAHQLLARAVSGSDGKLEAFPEEVAAPFREQEKLIRTLFGDPDRRVTTLENRIGRPVR